MWLKLCMILLAQSVLVQVPETSIDNKVGMLYTLCELLQDRNTIEYFLSLYRKNKGKEWPEFVYDGPFSTVFDEIVIPEDVKEGIRRTSEKKCTNF